MSGFEQYEKNQGALQIKNELNDYFKFVSLLEKKRPPKNVQLIEEFIKNESNIIQRIRFIEQLDEETKYREKIESSKKIEIDKHKEKKTKEVNRVIESSSLLSYLFSSKKVISNFGGRTQIVAAGFFGPRMTGESEFHYKNIINKVNNNILKSVVYITDNGWEKLDRKSYNVIVTFSKFIKLFAQLGNILQHNDIRATFREVEMYIHPYLQVVTYKANKEILKESYYEVLFFNPDFKPKFREIISTLNELLNTESRGMCFFNILLGIYMCRFKHFVKMSDLQNHYNVQPIDDTRYDLSPKLTQHIREQIASMHNKYKKAERELFFLRYLDESFDFEIEEDNPVYKIFAKIFFSDKLKHPKTFDELKKETKDQNLGMFLEHSQSNLTNPIHRLVEGFLRVYNDLLRGQITIITNGEKQEKIIFTEWLFANELDTLKQCSQELELLKSVNAYLSISFKTYQRFNQTGQTELEKEEKNCRLIKRIITTFFDLSEKLAAILYGNYQAHSLEGEEKLHALSTQDKPIDDITGNVQLIPYSTHNIANHAALEDQMLVNALTDANMFSINLCLLFHFHTLFDRMGKKQPNITYTEDYINIKSKIEDHHKLAV